MFQIKDLLTKFAALEDPKEARSRLASVLNNVCKIHTLDAKSLEVKKNIVWLKVHPGIKQRIIMNKSRCLEMIKSELASESIVDIR